MEKLSKIFDSGARVKIMRLFLFNAKTPFDLKTIVERTKVDSTTARREIKILSSIEFVLKKSFTKTITAQRTQKTSKKKVDGFMLNSAFPLVAPLKSLLIDSELTRTKDLPKRFSATGNIKMLVLSGIFMKDDERSLDILIVGEKIDTKKLQRSMEHIESEIGKELRYSVFTPTEFKYRIDMYDQNLLDIFKYPHERVVDKLGLIL